MMFDDRQPTEPLAQRASAGTLGGLLEHDRLERCARRVNAIIAELRRRAGDHASGVGRNSRHIELAIADFEAQAASIDVRLQQISRIASVSAGSESSGGLP
jgi:hypothetical protein